MQDDAAAACHDSPPMSAALQQHVRCGEMALAGTQLRAARHSEKLPSADHTLEQLQVLASTTQAAADAAATAAALLALAQTLGACGADDGTAVILEAARTTASEAAAAQALLEARRVQAAAVQEEAHSYAAAHDHYMNVLRALCDSDVVQPDEPSCGGCR
jgi:hypothetical protein